MNCFNSFGTLQTEKNATTILAFSHKMKFCLLKGAWDYFLSFISIN